MRVKFLVMAGLIAAGSVLGMPMSASAGPANLSADPAPAARPGHDVAGADASLAKWMAPARVPRAAATPGGALTSLAPAPVASPRGSSVVGGSSTSCAKQAAALAAGTIASYNCVQVTGVNRVRDKNDAMSATAWPSECSPSSATLLVWQALDRRNACDSIEIDYTVLQQPSGKVVGTGDLHAVNTSTASTAMARWSSTTYLWLWSSTGTLGAPQGATGSLFGHCPGSCVGTGGTWTSHPPNLSWSGTGNVDVQGLAPGAIEENVYGYWNVAAYNVAWSNELVINYSGTALSRCDNAYANRAPGCVYPLVPGVIGFSQATVPDFVYHVYNAQLSGLPGRMSTGTYLTRLTDTSLQSKNSTKACPSTLKRPTGYDCDEYPFASTYQGAYSSGATLARSFPGCGMPDPQRTGPTGWSRCFILSGQNRSAGGTTAGFYANERMLANDPFEIGYL